MKKIERMIIKQISKNTIKEAWQEVKETRQRADNLLKEAWQEIKDANKVISKAPKNLKDMIKSMSNEELLELLEEIKKEEVKCKTKK